MQGGVHPQPVGCSPDVYGELAKCWNFDPSQRPEFAALESFFAGAAAQAAKGNSTPGTDAASHGVSEEGSEMPTAENMRRLGQQGGGRRSVIDDAEGYVMPAAENMQQISQPGGYRCPGDDDDDEGYEMPTAENMRRISKTGGDRRPGDDDAEGWYEIRGYLVPTAENMRRVSAALPQSAGAAPAQAQVQVARTVVNSTWEHEGSLGSQSSAAALGSQYGSAGMNGGRLQETAFDIEATRAGPPEDNMFKEYVGVDAVPGAGVAGKKAKRGKIKKGDKTRISLTRHNSASAMMSNPLHQGTSA